MTAISGQVKQFDELHVCMQHGFLKKLRLPEPGNKRFLYSFAGALIVSYFCSAHIKKKIIMTVIVPTDFSDTANNAVRYAAQMLRGQYDASLIVFHVYEKAGDEEETEAALVKLKEDVLQDNPVKIETRCEESGDFISSLDRLARHLSADLVVMGITGKNRLAQMFFGSNTLKMVERNACPVLIVPPAAQFTEIKNVALTSDFKDVDVSIPVVPIKNVLRLFAPALHVVNVNSEHYISLTAEFLKQRDDMLRLFEEFNPQFYFIHTYEVEETIHQFALDKNIDLLITVPRHRTLFTGLYKSSTTKKLAYESAIPILAAHE
jgi:nucleotide-binding universal stress UspA family protein